MLAAVSPLCHPLSPALVAQTVAFVPSQRWRILVGEDARMLDRAVRAMPEEAYQYDFAELVEKSAAMEAAPVYEGARL